MPDAATAVPVTAPEAPPPAPPRETKLDDLMLAMDVVDTLRHQEQLVERELDEEARERHLVERLREIYRSQGLEVTDQILVDGVRALKESRFVYTPPPPSTARALALFWVKRRLYGTRLGGGLLAAVLVWGGYQYFVVGAAERAAEASRIELTVTLPTELERLHRSAVAEARVPEARERADGLSADGRAALEAGNTAAARTAIAALADLNAKLRQEYTLRIVSRPNEQSGIWRIPPNRPGGRNFYLIVEAVGPNGSAVSLPITSEEDQKPATLSRFGVRVSERTFDAVRRDKADDGIIQNVVLGEKRRGFLEPTWSMPVAGGFITSGW